MAATVAGILLAAYAGVSLLYWLRVAWAFHRLWKFVPSLGEDEPPPRHWPKLSVVVPACNEADRLAPAVRTLLAEDYDDLEILLVDDRSTDGTGELIDELAAGDPRARALHITELPDGWLGKVHALDRGLAECTGEFVLFADADVHYRPGTLRRAMALCLEARLDHLAAMPQLRPAGFLLDATISLFLRQLMLATRPWAVSDPASKAHMGIGAFNLVRRSAFDKTEGFPWLRLEVADDIGLGLMMKRSGARCQVAAAFGWLELHWYRSLAEATRGAEKAYATVLHFSLARAAVLIAVVTALELSPVLTLVPLALPAVRPVGWAGLAVVAAQVMAAVMIGRWAPAKMVNVLAAPLAAPVMALGLIRAAVVGRRRGGVLWRQTLYSSATLRPGQRIRFP